MLFSMRRHAATEARQKVGLTRCCYWLKVKHSFESMVRVCVE